MIPQQINAIFGPALGGDVNFLLSLVVIGALLWLISRIWGRIWGRGDTDGDE